MGAGDTELPWEVRRGFQRWRRVGKKPRRGGSSRGGDPGNEGHGLPRAVRQSQSWGWGGPNQNVV